MRNNDSLLGFDYTVFVLFGLKPFSFFVSFGFSDILATRLTNVTLIVEMRIWLGSIGTAYVITKCGSMSLLVD